MATKTITRYRTRTVRAKSRRRAQFTLPLAVVAGFAPMGLNLWGNVKRIMAGDVAGGTQGLVIHTTGYNTDTKSFYWPALAMNYGPILAGFLLHKVAGRVGINRALAQARVPFIRI